MGQQQLLLLVLGVVIVGLAVVVGIQAFSENQVSANADAMVNDGVRIASDIQAYALKPQAFGGNGGWFGDTGPAASADNPTFSDIGYQAEAGTYSNVNGDYTIETETCADGLTGQVFVSGSSQHVESVCVAISGTNHDAIDTQVTIGDGSEEETTTTE